MILCLDILKSVVDILPQIDQYLFSHACKEFHHEFKIHNITTLCEEAAEQGHLKVLKYLTEAVIEGGYLEVLEGD